MPVRHGNRVEGILRKDQEEIYTNNRNIDEVRRTEERTPSETGELAGSGTERCSTWACHRASSRSIYVVTELA